MPYKRKNDVNSASNSVNSLNFRTRPASNCERGIKPVSEPTSILGTFVDVILYLCKKFLFYNINLKVALYLGVVFGVSVIADLVTFPKTYMSRPDNVFNKYFAKYAWGWNLLLLVPFVILTSNIYCICKRTTVFKYHFPRLIVATFFWYTWTIFFNKIEAKFGHCTRSSFTIKSECLKAGYFWRGMDISGHTFILIYGSLLIIEEARCFVKWDNLKEKIREENHYRTVCDCKRDNPLSILSNDEFFDLKDNFDKWSPIIKLLFIIITVLKLLWDIMLFCTILYYHNTLEKFLGGFLAIVTWYITYRLLYGNYVIVPHLPPNGNFINPKEKKPRYKTSNDQYHRQLMDNVFYN